MASLLSSYAIVIRAAGTLAVVSNAVLIDLCVWITGRFRKASSIVCARNVKCLSITGTNGLTVSSWESSNYIRELLRRTRLDPETQSLGKPAETSWSPGSPRYLAVRTVMTPLTVHIKKVKLLTETKNGNRSRASEARFSDTIIYKRMFWTNGMAAAHPLSQEYNKDTDL